MQTDQSGDNRESRQANSDRKPQNLRPDRFDASNRTRSRNFHGIKRMNPVSEAPRSRYVRRQDSCMRPPYGKCRFRAEIGGAAKIGGRNPMIRSFNIIFTIAAIFSVTGCARTTVMPLAADTLQITTHAAPICGTEGAQRVAIQEVAVETIKHGYDRYIVLGAGGQNNVRVVGTTPTTTTTFNTGNINTFGNVYGNNLNANSTYSGTSTSTTWGGFPIVAGTYDQMITIRMFREGDPGGANAISARDALGPNWLELVQKGAPSTC